MEVAECSEKLQFLKASASASMAYSIVQFPVKWQSIKYKLQKLCSNFQPEILNVPGDDDSCNEHVILVQFLQTAMATVTMNLTMVEGFPRHARAAPPPAPAPTARARLLPHRPPPAPNCSTLTPRLARPRRGAGQDRGVRPRLPRLRCRVARHRPPTFSSCPASHCQPPLHSLKSPASSSFAACSYPSAARGAETSPLSPTGAQYSRRRAEAAPRRGRRETRVAERRWALASWRNLHKRGADMDKLTCGAHVDPALTQQQRRTKPVSKPPRDLDGLEPMGAQFQMALGG
uniref:DUF7032 domain-containing protein n=1 Tax=Oryza rufipogon TaxID=4529 RepID=A0A0E0N3N5_ORYRU